MDCSVEKELLRWSYPESYGQWLNSEQRSVMSGVLQGSVLGPELFNVSINDTREMECPPSKPAGDTKLHHGAADMPEEQDALQRDLNKPGKWGISWGSTMSNTRLCAWVRLTPGIKRRWQMKGLESSPAKKNLGLLVNEKLDMSQQCVLAAQKSSCILGCIQRNMGSTFCPSALC